MIVYNQPFLQTLVQNLKSTQDVAGTKKKPILGDKYQNSIFFHLEQT